MFTKRLVGYSIFTLACCVGAQASASLEDTIKAEIQAAKDDFHKVKHQVNDEARQIEAKDHMFKNPTEMAEGHFWDATDLSPELSKHVADQAHLHLMTQKKFPSAQDCSVCHPFHFEGWAASGHAYAQVSPIFNAMQGTFIERTGGTNGDFCIRCHTPVGMTLNEPLFTANENRAPISREGVTCVVCHRLDEEYGRVSGRFPMKEGPIYDEMYGPLGNEVIKEVIARYYVSPSPDVNPGAEQIHKGTEKVSVFQKPVFCGMCHDVNSQNGFRLETAYTQFLNSPAAEKGQTCQDCHMSKTPGQPLSGYHHGPVAEIGGQPTPNQRLTDHSFHGPDYSIIHAGVYPHSVEGPAIAPFPEWFNFDYAAGWGSAKFELEKAGSTDFPQFWRDRKLRIRARIFIDNQIKRMETFNVGRLQLLRRGYQFRSFELTQNNDEGIEFDLTIQNGTDGHAVPTGFDAERVVFVQVTVTDKEGTVVFQSGDRDPNGDLRDDLSRYVHNGEVPYDEFLMSLQSDFLALNLRGGQRPEILTVDYSGTPQPFIRPNTASSLLVGHPPDTRKAVNSLPPNGSRTGTYKVRQDQLTGKGPYMVNIKFISQMMPVHLVWDVSGVGFDYGLSAKQIGERLVGGALTLWEHNIVLDAPTAHIDLRPTEEEIVTTDKDPYAQNRWYTYIQSLLHRK
ncbi:multiheme c-type cytochrome [Cerasicoccus maritimus]|uniref:multiheme c-type cytochrome n=1 Tax=Cerasicoccus maritimus TaxID=490089 RepID=UPI002852BCAF|nr:multiheme c-type cytochrome [Cerasicoccus maritimus]